MSAPLTPHRALTELLRRSGVAGISWAAPDAVDDAGSPYYQWPPQPTPAFPYVTYDIPAGNSDLTFEKDTTDNFDVTITVVGTRANAEQLGSPWSLASVFYYLDGFDDYPDALNGMVFNCIRFVRKSWQMTKEERGPDGGLVFMGIGVYEMQITYAKRQRQS